MSRAPRFRSRFVRSRSVLRLAALAAFAGAATLACATTPGAGTSSAGKPDRMFDDLGSYHHEVTTKSALAQRWFDQGLRLSYGFNHDEARIAFYEATRLDPDCAMCWWGVAYTLGPNYNLPGDAERDREAWTAVQKARAAAATSSPREQAYVEAVAKRYAEHPPADRRPLDEAWAAGMGDVAKRFPDDLDAATIHAESLMDLQPWDLWNADGTPKGRAAEIVSILEGVLARDPQHPGANHYYIHAVEASRTPGRATAAADRLRDQNLTGAGHLVHMPSHIYSRTGRYADATEANAKAAAADEAYIQKWKPEGPYASMYYPHNVHFLAWAASMEGRSAEAIENARKVTGFLTPEMIEHMPMLEGIAASVEFVLVRFGRWDEVLALSTPPASQRYLSAMRHWARGMAFAGTRRMAEAQAESKALDAILAETPPDRIATQVNTGKRLLTVASEHLAGTIAARRGRTNDAVKHLTAAIAAEDELVYMEPPDWFAPLRPYLGNVLLDAGRAKEAEAVLREDLRRNPENGWALHGLAKALAKQGRDEEAIATRARFEKAWARADVTPSLAPRTAQGAESPTASAR